MFRRTKLIKYTFRWFSKLEIKVIDDRPPQIPTSFGHELRACLRCRLQIPYDQLHESGCENRPFFKMDEESKAPHLILLVCVVVCIILTTGYYMPATFSSRGWILYSQMIPRRCLMKCLLLLYVIVYTWIA